MIDYRKLRLKNITSAEFKHTLLLFYWPVYLFAFFFIERSIILEYKPVESFLDAKIPFCEFFIIPYFFWYFFLAGISVYTLLFDIKAFKKFMGFIIITFSVASILFVLFPNMQNLRPTEFPRDNFLTDTVKFLYTIDTNTNVCPSLHVAGSLGVVFASWNSKGLNKFLPRLIISIIAILIILATVFLKQHSVIDVFAGIILSFIVLPLVFILPQRLKKLKKSV